MINTAVIMAAGLGSRFGIYTEDRPKAFIEVGGKTMIERSIETLKSCGIKHIVIGTGYKKKSFEELAERYNEDGSLQVECCFSPRFAETNSMYTLYNMREHIKEDFILLESDLVFDNNAILGLINSEYNDVMLCTPIRKFQDQYYVEYDNHDILTNCSTDKNALVPNGEMVGIHKISKEFYVTMCEDYGTMVNEKPKLGYEFELLRISKQKMPMYVLQNHSVNWYEIDDMKDLEYAEKYIVHKL